MSQTVKAKAWAVGLAVAYLAALGFLAYSDSARGAPIPAVSATSEYQSPLEGTDGFCVEVGSVTPTNLFASIPVRFDALEKSQFRWLIVTHWDAADSTAAVCTSYGATGATTSLKCNGTTDPTVTTAPIFYQQSERLLLSRNADATVRPLYAIASTSTVTVCLKVGW